MDMRTLLLLLAPVIVAEVVLALIALFSIYKTNGVKNGNKYIWTGIVVFLQILGPILYFAFGRGEGETA